MERIELAFLRMMRRLEAERRRAGSAALQAQEQERARVARDLHDEVNQSLTGLLLRLEAAREAAPPELEAELAETKALANQAMRELLSLARQLRPDRARRPRPGGGDRGAGGAAGARRDRGRVRAPTATSPTSATTPSWSSTGSPRRRSPTPPATAAPAGSRCDLRRLDDGGVELAVADDGRGFAFDESEGGLGIAGMRERALLIGGELTIESRPGRGTTVRLTVPGESQPMRVLIADDHGIVRSGIRLLLERQPDIEVVAEAADGAEARELAVRERPDLAILDVKMPKLTGLQATREIKRQAPEVSVLILSMHDDERYLFEALKAGASGYVLKAQADTDLLAAIRAVERGEPFLTPEAQRTLIKDVLERGSSGEEELTPREEEIVKLVAEAHTTKQIAEVLHLSEKTVENHRANAMRKLGMRDRVELVRYAIRRGLIEP